MTKTQILIVKTDQGDLKKLQLDAFNNTLISSETFVKEEDTHTKKILLINSKKQEHESEGNEANLNSLPMDILYHICLHYLDLTNIVTLCGVNSKLRDSLQQSSFWEKYCQQNGVSIPFDFKTVSRNYVDLGKVYKSWRLFSKWQHQLLLSSFNVGATEHQIYDCESQLGFLLPSQLRSFLMIRNGQSMGLPILLNSTKILDCKSIVEVHQERIRMHLERSINKPGVLAITRREGTQQWFISLEDGSIVVQSGWNSFRVCDSVAEWICNWHKYS